MCQHIACRDLSFIAAPEILGAAVGALLNALTGRTMYRVPTAVLRDESLAAEALAGEHFDHVYASPLRRVQETAAPICEAHGDLFGPVDHVQRGGKEPARQHRDREDLLHRLLEAQEIPNRLGVTGQLFCQSLAEGGDGSASRRGDHRAR